MRTVRVRLMAGVVAGLALLATACSEPTKPTDAPTLAKVNGATVHLPACRTDVTQSATQTSVKQLVDGVEVSSPITVSVAGSSITVPQGAIPVSLLPAAVTLTVPASRLMEINITVNGAEHIAFLGSTPADVVISYARCSGKTFDKKDLTAFEIDPATKAPLEDKNGTDDKVARTVSFSTDHLSGYAVAW